MKKCLIVSTVSRQFTLFERGNIEVLKELGYEVHCVANYSDATEELEELGIIEHNIDIQRSPFSLKNIKAYKQLKNIINSDKYDLIHCHSPMGGVLARLAAKKTRKINHTRVIYTAHGFHFFKGASLINWMLYYPVEKCLSKYTDCLITINQEDYNIASKKFKARKVELVNGIGVDENKFNFEMSDEEKHELRENLGLKKDDFILIQVGELNKNKNQIMAINAMKDLVKENKNIHLLIVGKGKLEDCYKQKIKEYKLEKNVHMLGYRTDIPQLMKSSNVLLSLSYREGLPVNVIEGMICGLPVIATDCRGNRDLVQNNKNGYIVQNDDIKNLTNQIITTMNKKYIVKIDIEKYYKEKIEINMKQIYENIIRKRIIHLLSSNSYSGAENVACQIINIFRKENDYIMYYCSPDGNIRKELETRKIKYIPIKEITRKNLRKIIVRYQIDIIHAHDLRASIVASTLHNFSKVISHIHGNHMFMRKLTIKSILYNFSSSNYAHIYWVSKSSFDNYLFKTNVNEKSSVLYNVIDEEEIKTKVLEKQNVKQYDIVFIGRLSEPKNPIKLIDVIQKVSLMKKDLKCAIIGKGELEEVVQKKIENISLSNSIELFGYMNNPFPILSHSKILLMTSTHEGLPMIVLEALALGIPIISTPTDGIAEIMNEKMGFLSENDDELAGEAYKIITNNELRKRISEECKKIFKEINDINDYKRKLKANY